MIKYAVYTETAQIDYDTEYTTQELWEAYYRQSFTNPTCVGRFDTHQEAKEEFEFHAKNLRTTKERGCGNTRFLMADFVFIQEEEWDEWEDEFIQAPCIWECAVKPYKE